MWNPPLVRHFIFFSCFRNQMSLTLDLGGNQLHFYIIVTFVIEIIIFIHIIICPFLSLCLMLIAACEKDIFFSFI